MDLFQQPAIIEAEAQPLIDRASVIFAELDNLEFHARIHAINKIRLELHKHSPFASEPVDCVQWIAADSVSANDYNPNSVAPPEMKLLEHSIREDGYTQPIVAWPTEKGFEVIDGFHRHRVGRESKTVRDRVRGYLPLTIVNAERTERNDRIASTIRHNRARGKHKVEAMSDIVVELKRRNWSDERICRELGMEQDEVLRLCQITGLAELFTDQEFSKSWDVEGEVTEEDFEELTDDISTYGDEASKFRTVNTSDENRIFHTHDKWECYKAGFYNTHKDGMTKMQGEEQYRAFLSNSSQFEEALKCVISDWKHSCEHYLTNVSMNRVAWLGQASVAQSLGIPSYCRGGYHLLTDLEKQTADLLALKYLNIWLKNNGRVEVSLEEAYSGERQSDIY